MPGKRALSNDYWCHPQKDGHAPMYFLGDQQISRAEYVDAVGAADCDPHVMVGRTKVAKRELIDTGTDKRYVRRTKTGQFKESDDVGRSLAADRRTKAKTIAGKGQGDKGDRRR